MRAAMRSHHQVLQARDSNAASHSRCAAAPHSVIYRVGVLAALIVAFCAAAAISGLFTHAPALRATREPEAAQECASRYAAVLDLAELARREGKSSKVVVRGLSDRRGALNTCLPISSSGQASQ
jgi:hypothetical protein